MNLDILAFGKGAIDRMHTECPLLILVWITSRRHVLARLNLSKVKGHQEANDHRKVLGPPLELIGGSPNGGQCQRPRLP
jgi:hypothetical protein